MEKLQVKIEKLDHQGRGIAKIDGIPVFIAGTLPNEKVEIEITKKKKNFMEGRLISITDKSNDRVEYNCPYYKECGGCDIAHLNYQNQLNYKENKVKEIVTKFAGLNESLVKNIIPSVNTNYRNKATFQVKNKVGFYNSKSYEIIDIDNCLIVGNKINEIIKLIKNNIDLKNIYQIVIRTSHYTGETMVIFKISANIDTLNISRILKDKVTSIFKYKDGTYELIEGKPQITEELNGLKFKISPDSFFQVNTIQAESLYKKVLEYAEISSNESILDLYCGTGTIGLYLSKYAKRGLGIEINNYAVEDANRNKLLNNITNMEFICGDAGKLIKNIKHNYDVVIVDPPRSGLMGDAVNHLKQLNSKKLVYVSCDPITMARDLKILSDLYEIKEITPFDMFPNTNHVECVVRLVRKDITN